MPAAAFNTTLFASATKTASGNTDTVNGIVGIIGAVFFINVSAVSGSSPTLDLTLQALDAATNAYVDLVSIAQITATGRVTKIVYPNASGAIYQVLPAQYRWKYAIAGTNPSFTFSIGANYLP